MNVPSTRTLQTAVLAFVVIGLLTLALSGYLNPLSRILIQPFISAQTWLSTRYQAIQDLVSRLAIWPACAKKTPGFKPRSPASRLS